MRLPLLALLTVLLAGGAGAQIVSPAHFTRAAAGGTQYGPVGIYWPARHMQVHDDLRGTPRVIRGLAFRRDHRALAHVGFAGTCDIVVSTARTTAATMDHNLANNHGRNRQQVATRLAVAIPASAPHMPAPFEYRVPFPQPYAFDGAGSLCWEIVTHGRSLTLGTTYDHTTKAREANPRPVWFGQGAGCGGLDLIASGGADWPMGTVQASFWISGASPNAPILLVLGHNAKRFGSVPLPFEIPGTRGSRSGPCFMHVAPVLWLPLVSDRAGDRVTTVTLPVHAGMNGATLYGQVFTADGSANSIGIVASRTAGINLLAPYGLQPVSTGYEGANQRYRFRNVGFVVQFF